MQPVLIRACAAAAFVEYEDIRDAEDATRKLDGFQGWVRGMLDVAAGWPLQQPQVLWCLQRVEPSRPRGSGGPRGGGGGGGGVCFLFAVLRTLLVRLLA